MTMQITSNVIEMQYLRRDLRDKDLYEPYQRLYKKSDIKVKIKLKDDEIFFLRNTEKFTKAVIEALSYLHYTT